MKKQNNYFWLSAFVIGTVINTGLFFVLPSLGRSEPVIEPQVIAVEFIAWQQPASKPQAKPKPVQKKKPKPKKKRKLKPKKKPKPKIKPPPKVTKKPVLSEAKTPEKSKPEPIEEPVIEPVEVVKTPLESDEEEVLPIPAPIFKLTSMPRVLHQAALVYPVVMRNQGKEATVKLEILLDLKGKIRRINIIKSGGEAFDKAAIDAMQNSTFLPGNINGKPVAVLLKKKIRFRLQ